MVLEGQQRELPPSFSFKGLRSPLQEDAMRSLLPVCLVLLFVGCAKEEAVPPPEATAPDTQPAPTTPAPAPPVQAQQTVTLPAGAPVPANGVLLWLSADDAVAGAQGGKVLSWQNPNARGAGATAAKPDHLPAVVADAINGHAAVRFDGTEQMLIGSIDIGPTRMPEGTVITVFRSATADASPLRKLYGNDNGGYDRAVGFDDRAPGSNFTLFTGLGVAGYFQLAPNTVYVAVDEYSPKKFSGWINGIAVLTAIDADWQTDALPNLYLGGTGNVYSEYWNGDLAEILVYARKLDAAERMQVEDYLGKKYAVAIARSAAATTTSP